MLSPSWNIGMPPDATAVGVPSVFTFVAEAETLALVRAVICPNSSSVIS